MRILLALTLALASTPASAETPTGPYVLGPALKGPPKRIVTIAPSLTEMVLALGAGEHLVGVSRYDEDPAVAKLPRIGGYIDPNLEAILALRPDLVVVEPSPGNEEVVRRLADLGVTVRVVTTRTVAEIHTAMKSLGQDLGAAAAARKLSTRLARALDEIQALARKAPPVRAVLIIGHEPLIVAGPETFLGELLTLAGGENIITAPTPLYPALPLETLVAKNPTVIIDVVVHGSGVARPAPFADLKALSAVREGRVIHLTSTTLLRPGPSLAEGVRELFEALHRAPNAAEETP